MKALILAAGYAVRMYPLTKEYPKPLLEAGSKPIIDYIVEKLENIEEIDEIIVVTNSKFVSQFRRWLLNSLKISKRISLVDDLTKDHQSRRGAIGDIDFVINKKRIKDDLLVIGGDNLFNDNLDEFLSFAKCYKALRNRMRRPTPLGKAHPVIGAFDIRDKQGAKKFGVVKLSKDNLVVDFAEKPKEPKSTLVAMCLYYFPKGSLGLFREYMRSKKEKKDATGFYIDWLRKREPVYGFVFKGKWYDIGDPLVYHEANDIFSGKLVA